MSLQYSDSQTTHSSIDFAEIDQFNALSDQISEYKEKIGELTKTKEEFKAKSDQMLGAMKSCKLKELNTLKTEYEKTIALVGDLKKLLKSELNIMEQHNEHINEVMNSFKQITCTQK